MNTIKCLSAMALAAGLMGSIAAHAAPQNAKNFKNAMQNASQARLNHNGSNALRFDADQDATIRNVTVANSGLRMNSVHVDDSLIADLDVDQDAKVRRSTISSSNVSLNSLDMTRARSIHSDVDQDVTVRNLSAYGATVSANTISIR